MNRDRMTSGVLSGAAAAAVAVFGVAAMLLVLSTGSMKVIGGVLAGGLVVSAALLSGNPRLFCIYGFGLTLPFDLSKRFGPVIEKMGGETAFRVEMSDPFLFGLALFLAQDLVRKQIDGIRVPKIVWLWLAIAAMGLVPVIFGPYRLTAAQEMFRMVKVIVLFLILLNEMRTQRKILHFAAAIISGVIVQAIVGLAQSIRGANLGLGMLGESAAETIDQLATNSVQGQTVFRASAFLVHPNIFGVFLAVTMPLAIGLALLTVGKFHRSLFLIAPLLGLPALIGTLSRSGWISFALTAPVVIIMMIGHPKLRGRAVLAAAVGAIVGLLVFGAYSDRIITRVFSSYEGAMLGRAEWNRDARRMIVERPWFGWGLNAYVYSVPPFTRYGPRAALDIYQGWIPAVHNIYYLWLAELGAVGFTLHMWLIAWLVILGIRNLGVSDTVLFTINAAILAALVGFAFDGFFSFSLRMNAILRLFWTFAALLFAIRYWRLFGTALEPVRPERLGVPARPVLVDLSAARSDPRP